jgi:hypothetical protein
MSWGVPNIELAFKVLIPEEKQSDLDVSGLQELVLQSLPAGSREFIRSTYSMSFWKMICNISQDDRLGAKKTLTGMQFDYENGSEAQGRAILLPSFAKIGPGFFEGMLKNHLHVLIHLSRREPYSPGYLCLPRHNFRHSVRQEDDLLDIRNVGRYYGRVELVEEIYQRLQKHRLIFVSTVQALCGL